MSEHLPRLYQNAPSRTSAFYQTTDSYSFQAPAPNAYRLFVGIDSITQNYPEKTPHQDLPPWGRWHGEAVTEEER